MSVIPPPGPQPGPIYNLAAALLSRLVAVFEAKGILPAGHYVSNGHVAYDIDERPGTLDELLVVEVEGLGLGFPGQTQLSPVFPSTTFLAALAVHVIRDAPVLDDEGFAPTGDEIDGSARQVLYDQWLVAQTILTGLQARTLFLPDTPGVAPPVSQPDAHITDSRAWGPRGGVAGSITRLAVSLA